MRRREFLAAAVAPAITRSSQSPRGYTAPEIAAFVQRGRADAVARDDIPTPALLLGLDAFEANIAKMAAYLKGRGKAFRPHGKTHKCPEIARALVRAGAVGTCAAKLSEAEVFANHGVKGLLVTTQVVGRRKIERAVALARKQPDTIFVVDDERIVRDFDAAAQAGKKPLVVNVAIDLLFGRTGVPAGDQALELARLIGSLKHVRLAGIQAYDGGASHTVGFDARRTRSLANMGRAVETRRLFEQDGLPCALLTGGSTGTYNIDSELEGVTELQPGSFMFMDIDYNRIGGQDGPVYRDFENALTVVTTVVSRRPDVAIVDGGYKAFSTDRPFTPEVRGLEGIVYSWAGDEHGRLDLKNATADVKLGDRIELVVPHCDPSVNLYDRIHCLRGDRLEATWSVAGRGMAQ